jgi:hypothetical protein
MYLVGVHFCGMAAAILRLFAAALRLHCFEVNRNRRARRNDYRDRHALLHAYRRKLKAAV